MHAATIAGKQNPCKPNIMVVDDSPQVLDLLSELLELHGNQVITVQTGELALRIAEIQPPDLILLDITMPDMDGFQVCENLKRDARLMEIPVIFLSGMNATDEKVRGLRMGAVDYITKPFHIEEVLARVATHLNLRSLQKRVEVQRQVEEKIREISDAQSATIFALAKLAEYRDEDTGTHLERVREYCRILAKKLSEESPYETSISEEFIECIQHAAPLHDIGKVAIPDSILLKPGKLTDDEFNTMKSHTIIGAENMQIVYNNYSGNAFIGMGIEIALYHHERFDGKGYPDGLVGRNIPLSARIMAVADVYDALRSDRCYRKGFDHEQVKTMILEQAETHFDPVIVEAFLSLEEDFQHIMETLV